MSSIAIIPARGGSKRIPRKNVKDFLGKPIIAYSIEAALKSGMFDEVMVSTDDKEIAKIAQQYGAKVPFLRSTQTSNDVAPLRSVLIEVMDELEKRGEIFDYMCCILPTAPLISPTHIQESFKKLSLNDKATSLYSIVKYSYPIQRSFVMLADGEIEMKWKEYQFTRSQDLEETYHDAGMFYWHNVEKWRKGLLNKIGYELKEIEVQDIDTPQDWEIAEIKFKLLNGKEKNSL